MTTTKDIVETASPATETTVTQPNDRPKSDAGHLRSDAVSLDVPVKIHGSRVTDVVRGITSHTEPFEEQTATMIVFPQGGVLKMSTTVTVGQMLVLTNLKTGHDAICRIVKVRACAPSQSYVEIEFTNRQPGYWGVQFASDGPAVAQKSSPLAAPFVAPVAQKVAPPVPTAVVPPVTRKVEAESPRVVNSLTSSPLPTTPGVPPERSAQKAKPESSFVGIGSKEEVQPSAAETLNRTANRVIANTNAPSLSAHTAASVSSLGSGIPGEMMDSDDEEISPADSHASFGGLAATDSLGTAPSAAFGSRFDVGARGASSQASTPGKASGMNWTLMGIGGAALLALAAGAAFYAHLWPSADKPASATPPAPVAAVETSTGQTPGPDAGMQASQANPSPSPKTSGVTSASDPASARSASASQVDQTLQITANASPKASKAAPKLLSALNAHPSSTRRTNFRDAVPAPSLDPAAASANDSGALQTLGASSVLAPLTSGTDAKSNGPVPPGGDVKPPRLVHSVMPVYPSVAKASRAEGSVVIDTSIDTGGNVTINKVISGPILLRQAALDALSHWKYQPATLNGTPVAVKFTVTIQFHQ